MKRICGICIFLMLLTTMIIGANGSLNESRSFNGNDDFTQWFENPTGQTDMEGTDFTTSDGSQGHIHRISDTKSPPTDEMDICDNVVIEWKNPIMKRPWVTYHIDDMSPTGGHGWYFHFDYKSSNRKAPFNMPEPPEGLPPFPGEDDERNHFVDDDNINGPWTGSFDHPFNQIQDAIDAANSCDSIRVLPGIYNENLVILKDDITITTHLPSTEGLVRVDGDNSGDVVTIISDFVYLSGSFSFEKSGSIETNSGLSIEGNNNTIIGVTIKDCTNGINLHNSACNNVIYENTISNNVWGLFAMHDCTNNFIYNNNFISNSGFHIKDYSMNQYVSQFYHGNYWDDYDGVDQNSDGLGDTPYYIQVADNMDTEPLMSPWENQGPETPIINGPDSGDYGETYNYSFESSDPNDHDVYFEIKWGDGTEEKSPGYVASDSEFEISHTWDSENTYILEARAVDDYGFQSDWSTLQVSIAKTKDVSNPFLRFLENHPNIFPILQRLIVLQ